jgi:hypothetical protein
MEILLTTFLLALVLAAALSPFQFFQRSERHAAIQNDSQQQARTVQDQLIRELRNVAGQTQLIERAAPYDLLFQTIDGKPKPTGSQNERNVMRVRYCLGSTPEARGRVIVQHQRWTTAAVPAHPDLALGASDPKPCPSASPAWDVLPGTSARHAVAAEDVVNREVGRPLFQYDSAQRELITRIRTDVWVDPTPGRAPAASQLTSGVFLRNQNRAPRAGFTVTPLPAVPRGYLLNASASHDPESMPLLYRWTLIDAAGIRTLVRETDEVVVDHQVPAGQHRLELVVLDRARIPSAACVIDLPPTTTTQCPQP